MSWLDKLTGRRRFGQSLLLSAVAMPLAAASSRVAQAQGKQEPGVPGGPISPQTQTMDKEADAIQKKFPIEAINEFLNGFHFYADDMGRQVEANHFCKHLSEGFHQCVIYDSDQPNSRLIGIEYIVSEEVFKSLPDDEKRLWHSHNYEVKSGELIAPGLPNSASEAFMKSLVTTYGKTWHTWQIDRYPHFPMSIPQLMMGFTQDGQVNPQLVQDRDKRFNVSTQAQRKARAGIPWPKLVPGANAWESGKTVQLTLHEVPVRNIGQMRRP